MTTSRIDRSVSRRSAIAGIGAGGAAVALAAVANRASAQEGSLADHPLTGTWMTIANSMLPDSPQVPHVAQFFADGTVLLLIPPGDIGPDGPMLQSASVGIWEAYDAQRGHFIVTQTHCDLNGNVVGMVTVEGYPLVNEDGQSFSDDGEMVTVTIRDPFGVVLDSFPGAGAPVRGNRLTFDNATFPEPTS
jgi:hypothetical protein